MLLEGKQRDAVFLGEALDLLDEGRADRFHERRRDHWLLAVVAKERNDPAVVLQLRLVDVEVHAVDAFDGKRDMFPDDFGNRAWYTHRWLRLTSVPRDHHRLAVKMRLLQQTSSLAQPEPFLFTATRKVHTPRRSEAEPR